MDHIVHETERRYRELQRHEAAVNWRGTHFDQFLLRPFLEFALPRLSFSVSRPKALEYGTGTGPGACFLAARGFEVDGIDVCPTAIEMAQKFAAERSLRIHYEVQDIRTLPCGDRVYDLVVDNYCLHFSITNEARRRVLDVVRGLVSSGGYYLIGTVVHRAGRDYEERIRDPQSGVVYRPATEADVSTPAVVVQGGRRYILNRRHVTAEFLRAEVEQAGFHVLFQEDGHVICTANAAHAPWDEAVWRSWMAAAPGRRGGTIDCAIVPT
jgi:SAM-dependent methyltransferase